MKEKIINGYRLGIAEAKTLMSELSNAEIFKLADELRHHFRGNKLDTCMIHNAKSGRCSEDCKWCSQSVFHTSKVEVYDFVDYAAIKPTAEMANSRGVHMLSLVTSGKKLSKTNVDRAALVYKQIKSDYPELGCCASMGLLTKEELETLYKVGVRRYHCNIETAPSRFSSLCSTHSLEDKLKTIQAAQEVGMTVCSGGIIGMGETEDDRIEMAVFLQKLDIRSIPVNILTPIEGTKLSDAKVLSDEEILRSFALFRIINPEADIRFAAGRKRIHHIQTEALKAGVSASIVGDFLTTMGVNLDEDLANFRKLAYEI